MQRRRRVLFKLHHGSGDRHLLAVLVRTMLFGCIHKERGYC